jgi:cellulose synthase/poly-beta-1,6-N-acetylglucosamine synthase-like glycosyltransferase
MRDAETLDERDRLPASLPSASQPTTCATTDPSASPLSDGLSVCVVCCSTASLPHDAALNVADAVRSEGVVRTLLLSETGSERTAGAEVIAVPHGTKLSKLRHLADLVVADLFCICDPDLAVETEACRTVLQVAMANVQARKEVVAFGIVEGRNDGSLLSQTVAIDKWCSHRVLRRCLWAAGVGITLPGQFLVVSPGLLRSLEPGVDSYLDDLYLGWVARQRGVCVHRVPVVVGREDPRSSWPSLLAQRTRWMRGLVCLFRHLFPHPSALGLLGIHFVAYHGLPILAMIAFLGLTVVNPLVGGCVFVGLAIVLSIVTRQSFLASVAFLSIFPFVHLLATALWWMPVKRSVLTRR